MCSGADPGGGGGGGGCNPPKALGNQHKIKESSSAAQALWPYFSTRARATCAINWNWRRARARKNTYGHMGRPGPRGPRGPRLSCALPECWQHQSDFSNGQGVRECHMVENNNSSLSRYIAATVFWLQGVLRASWIQGAVAQT